MRLPNSYLKNGIKKKRILFHQRFYVLFQHNRWGFALTKPKELHISKGKELACDASDPGSISWLGRSSGEW